MNLVDPRPTLHVDQTGEFSIDGQYILVVEASNLAPVIERMAGMSFRRAGSRSPENGLAKLTRHAVPSVQAGTLWLDTTLARRLGTLSGEGRVRLLVGGTGGIRGAPWNRMG